MADVLLDLMRGVCVDSYSNPDSKVHGANMWPIWGRRQDPGGPHVSPMNFAIWDFIHSQTHYRLTASLQFC